MMEKLFQDFVKYATENLAIEGIAIADGEKVLLEHHFTPDLARNIYSHTKSYMVTAVGIAISEGKLNLTDRLVDFFPREYEKSNNSALEKIQLKHLLTMSSGFDKGLLMGADRRKGTGYPDYISYMFSQEQLVEPGTKFTYSTADSILAGRMVEQATNENLSSYLYKHVFSKLGQGFPLWENCPQGHPIGGGGMSMKLTDMMKLGQVYLNEGTYHGERIVDCAFVKEASSLQIEIPKENDVWRCGYGYQFWLSPYKNAYRADGAYGQISTVLPESGLVVAVQCPEVGDFNKVKLALHEMVLSQL